VSVVHAVIMGGIEIRIGVVCMQTVLGIHIVKRSDISRDNAVLFVMVNILYYIMSLFTTNTGPSVWFVVNK